MVHFEKKDESTSSCFFLATLGGMQDLSSLTRDGTHVPYSGNAVLTTGLPAEAHERLLGKTVFEGGKFF